MGQCLVEMMVNPPKEGDESYELYSKEYNGIKEGLKSRATALYEAFKEMEGVELDEPQVSTYPSSLEVVVDHRRAQCICSLPYTYQTVQ